VNILIPMLDEDCVALRVVRAEGYEPITRVMRTDTDYGTFVASFWRLGEAFMIVEHDIAPWPGAIAKIEACPLPWCGYQYPAGEPGYLGGSLGCVRFSKELVSANADACIGWDETPWRGLDGLIESRVQAIVRYPRFHPHEPPVAHARVNMAGDSIPKTPP
jgi:hypothetical protein